jgi:hypothetical protein
MQNQLERPHRNEEAAGDEKDDNLVRHSTRPDWIESPEREPSYQLGSWRQPCRFTALHRFTWAFLASLSAR